MMLWVIILPALTAATVTRAPRSCGPCDPSSCAALPSTGCAFRVMDACGCCELCAAGPGEPCGARGAAVTRCASGLECVKAQEDKKKLKKKTEPGVCVCKNGNYEVCGSDGVEYRSVCELRAASASAERQGKTGIKVHNKGKCTKAPVIVTGPGEVWNVTGAQVFLSCEAIGVPTPVLTWRKITDNNKKSQLLPGDQDNLAIQMRGGPEKHEVTGWVLIFPLTKDTAGMYECHVNNAMGEASATGTIHVVDSVKDIPSKKVVLDDKL
ncbi:insulin-like growth factor-binding protein 7 [Ictalurus furcatus]|uniref:insulin-like growth factor-binding protein 7 n=1 Tax=Ictalurus furcatus TaxID=66913 RepID=UPI002350BAC7|nr:insulin-like growth factor-binding protein 7 [Ictalurus furcatus]